MAKKASSKKLITLKCDVKGCGKTIISLSKTQAEYNMKVHKLTHENIGNDDTR
jgi:hypothetical protein